VDAAMREGVRRLAAEAEADAEPDPALVERSRHPVRGRDIYEIIR
jgi:hypothetical protein